MKGIVGDILATVRGHLDRVPISDREAAELGLSPEEARGLTYARPGMRQQLLQMARLFGLSAKDLNKDRWRALDIDRACSNCEKSGGCRNFLAGQWTSFTVKDCPNAEIYAELAAELQKPRPN